MKFDYHKIFMPFEDVYLMGGEEVFSHLSTEKGKNLVVIPFEYIQKLQKEKDNNNNHNAKGVLEYLVNLSLDRQKGQSKGKGKGKATQIDFDICHEGSVDIAIIHDQRNFSVTTLEETIKRTFGDKSPVFLTTKEEYRIKHSSTKKIEKPGFLNPINPSFLDNAIISGSQELYTALMESNGKIDLVTVTEILERELMPNQFVSFRTEGPTMYARVIGDKIKGNTGEIYKIDNPQLSLIQGEENSKQRNFRIHNYKSNNILGISANDMEQYLAMQYGLLDPNISTMFMTGMQGSGKTILAYSVAVFQVLKFENEKVMKLLGLKNEPRYKKIVLFKPTNLVGGSERDQGYLPGNLFEKLEPFLRSFKKAHEQSDLEELDFEEMFAHPNREKILPKRKQDRINNFVYLPKNHEAIELIYSGHVRGDTLTNNIIIVDEAQNYTPSEMKTIIERVGIGSKLIVLGDYRQIDNKRCSPSYNGLVFAALAYQGQPYNLIANLHKHYRSLASLHARNLKP